MINGALRLAFAQTEGPAFVLKANITDTSRCTSIQISASFHRCDMTGRAGLRSVQPPIRGAMLECGCPNDFRKPRQSTFLDRDGY
jgi:hypothetical protein